MIEQDESKQEPPPDRLSQAESDIEEFMKPAQTETKTPSGYYRHVVKQGECLSTISKQYGHFWQTIWKDSSNEALIDKRKNPDVLLPGDVLFLPFLREKQEPGVTEKMHRFRRKGVPIKLKMTFMGPSEPLANESYRLEFDTGEVMTGNLNGEGLLDVAIPNNAQSCSIHIGTEPEVTYQFDLGTLDPIDTITGIQARLENLGFSCGGVSGAMNPETRAALSQFQEEHKLEVTGEANRETRHKLFREHEG